MNMDIGLKPLLVTSVCVGYRRSSGQFPSNEVLQVLINAAHFRESGFHFCIRYSVDSSIRIFPNKSVPFKGDIHIAIMSYRLLHMMFNTFFGN